MNKVRKVVLVTGASSGIGFDAAQALAARGHKVYAAARRVEKMEPLKAKGIEVLRMDVTDEASMAEGVESILKNEGRIVSVHLFPFRTEKLSLTSPMILHLFVEK